MSYQYIEKKYPLQDPNIDLNFDNDILYGSLLNDELDKYNTKYTTTSDIIPKKNILNKSIKENRKEKSTIKIYFIFITIIIIFVLFWYIYGRNNEINKHNIIDTYDNRAELSMMSPDVGVGSRYRYM